MKGKGLAIIIASKAKPEGMADEGETEGGESEALGAEFLDAVKDGDAAGVVEILKDLIRASK